MLDVSKHTAVDLAHEAAAATVGMLDRYLAQSKLQLREVATNAGRIGPLLLLHSHAQPRLH